MFSFVLLISALNVAAEPAPMFQRASNLLEDRYLWLDKVDVVDGCTAAAEEIESVVPWIIVDPTDSGVSIVDARSDQAVIVVFPSGSEQLGLNGTVECLATLETIIKEMGSPLPKGVDVRVELTEGFMRSLDRHTVIMAKKRLARFDERIKGKLTGIGAELRMEDGVLWAQVVFPGSPAERGGLQKSDAIHRVDGVSTLGMSIQQAVERIRGAKGTDVVLSISRRNGDGSDSQFDLVFTRDEVHIPNVKWELGSDGVGVIRIDHFSDQTARLTAKALESFRQRAELGESFKGVLIDLRSNSGGSLIQSAETVDLFVSDGEIVRTEGRNGATVPNLISSLVAHPPSPGKDEADFPLVIMQNHKSASASEIVAGSLAALGRATVIGRQSYGKGTVQKLYTLRGGKDRVRLKMTVAEYRLHNGLVVHESGIEPDLVMRRVVFNTAGAWIPPAHDGHQPFIVAVDERVGWRSQGEFDKNADPLEVLGRKIVLEARGPSRSDGLEAIERIASSAEDEAMQNVSETFLLRNIDWRATDDRPSVLDASVNLEMMGSAVAGQKVRLNAEIKNEGPAPLYQARLRLKTTTRSPWRGATIPIGFVPPGETAKGTVEISIPASSPSRSDDVGIWLEADALDPLELDPVALDIEGWKTPHIAAKARLMPHGDHHRVEVVLENRGDIHLTGLRLRLGWREDSGVELLNHEAILPVLGAGQEGRFDLEVRLLEDLTNSDVPLEVRVGADRFPLLIQFPVSLSRDGQLAKLVRPEIVVQTPTRTEAGKISVPIEVEDDGIVDNVTVWWNGEKQAWLAGEGTGQLRGQVELDVEPGQNSLTIIAVDDGDLERRLDRRIWGAVPLKEDATE